MLAPQRRFSEAQREVTTALRLDPFSIIINHNMGAAYYYQGRFDEAIEQWKRTNEMDPTLLASHGTTNLVQAFVLSGRLGEAMQEVEKVSKLPKPVRGLHLLRAYVLAAMNRTTEARRILQEVESDYEEQHISPFEIGVVHFLLGDIDEGFDWLQTAYDLHDGSITWICAEHELRGVRGDPRFVALQKAVGLGHVQLG